MASNSSDFPFGILDVAELINLRTRRRGPDSIYADCPFCGEGRGRMNINYVKNAWRCNYCGESGGMLSLYAKVNGISNSEAYREICDALSMGEISWKYKNGGKSEKISNSAMPSEKRAGTNEILEGLPQSERASAQEVDQTYSVLLDMLSLLPKHKEHLISEKRGLTEEQILERRYKSAPPFFLCRSLTDRLMKQGCGVEGVPGFYLDDKGKWTMTFNSMTAGILIPCVGVDGLIKGIQILLDTPLRNKDDASDKKGAKYIWFSSSGKNKGTSSGSQVHFVGDPFAKTIYVTEGLLKADIAHYQMNRSFAAVAGANNLSELDGLFALLSQNGTEQIVEAHDMDKFSNEAIYKGKLKIYQIARKHGLKCLSLTWNPNYKGIDDWQLSFKRKEKRNREIQKMTFKKQYLSQLCQIDHIDSKVEEWHRLPKEKCSLTEYLGLSEEEYGIFLLAGKEALKKVLDKQCNCWQFRFYQLHFGEEQKPVKFAYKGFEDMKKAGYDHPPEEAYEMTYEDKYVCAADISEGEVLYYLWKFYGEYVPIDYRGRALAESDIIELYGQEESRFYYVDRKGFQRVKFSGEKVKVRDNKNEEPM